MSKRTDNIIYYSESQFFQKKWGSINWRFTLNCNYHCPYCRTSDHKKEFPTFELASDIAKFIFNLDFTDIRLTITGGEPSTYPQLLGVIKYLVDLFRDSHKSLYVCLWSNMSQRIGWYDKFMQLTNTLGNFNIKGNLLTTYHKEFISLDSFLEKYIHLYKTYNIFPFSYMLTDKSCVKLLNKLASNKDISFYTSPVDHDQSKLLGLNETTLKNEENNNRYLSIYYNNDEYEYEISNVKTKNTIFTGYMCSVFKKSLFIDYTGLVYNCFLSAPKVKPLNIYQDDVYEEIRKEPYLRCPVNNCDCDFSIPKIHMSHFNYLKNVDLKFIQENIKRKC